MDAVIYDKQIATDAEEYFPSLMPEQTPALENEDLLAVDESIHRCNDVALDLSAFSSGRLSPGADNFCRMQSSSSWLTDCAVYNGTIFHRFYKTNWS